MDKHTYIRAVVLSALVLVLASWGEAGRRLPARWQKDLVYSLYIPNAGKQLINTERPQLHTFGSSTSIASSSTKGSVLRFTNTANDFVTIEKSNWFDVETKPMTIEMIVNFAAAGTDKYVFSDHNASLNNACIGAVHKLTTGEIRLWYTRLGTFEVIATTTQITTVGQWNHIVFTRSGNTGAWELKAFVNGVREATLSTSKNPATAALAGTPTIGRAGSYTSGAFNHNGDVKMLNIWQRALTETEVRQRYIETFSIR